MNWQIELERRLDKVKENDELWLVIEDGIVEILERGENGQSLKVRSGLVGRIFGILGASLEECNWSSCNSCLRFVWTLIQFKCLKYGEIGEKNNKILTSVYFSVVSISQETQLVELEFATLLRNITGFFMSWVDEYYLSVSKLGLEDLTDSKVREQTPFFMKDKVMLERYIDSLFDLLKMIEPKRSNCNGALEFLYIAHSYILSSRYAAETYTMIQQIFGIQKSNCYLPTAEMSGCVKRFLFCPDFDLQLILGELIWRVLKKSSLSRSSTQVEQEEYGFIETFRSLWPEGLIQLKYIGAENFDYSFRGLLTPWNKTCNGNGKNIWSLSGVMVQMQGIEINVITTVDICAFSIVLHSDLDDEEGQSGRPNHLMDSPGNSVKTEEKDLKPFISTAEIPYWTIQSVVYEDDKNDLHINIVFKEILEIKQSWTGIFATNVDNLQSDKNKKYDVLKVTLKINEEQAYQIMGIFKASRIEKIKGMKSIETPPRKVSIVDSRAISISQLSSYDQNNCILESVENRYKGSEIAKMSIATSKVTPAEIPLENGQVENKVRKVSFVSTKEYSQPDSEKKSSKIVIRKPGQNAQEPKKKSKADVIIIGLINEQKKLTQELSGVEEVGDLEQNHLGRVQKEDTLKASFSSNSEEKCENPTVFGRAEAQEESDREGLEAANAAKDEEAEEKVCEEQSGENEPRETAEEVDLGEAKKDPKEIEDGSSPVGEKSEQGVDKSKAKNIVELKSESAENSGTIPEKPPNCLKNSKQRRKEKSERKPRNSEKKTTCKEEASKEKAKQNQAHQKRDSEADRKQQNELEEAPCPEKEIQKVQGSAAEEEGKGIEGEADKNEEKNISLPSTLNNGNKRASGLKRGRFKREDMETKSLFGANEADMTKKADSGTISGNRVRELEEDKSRDKSKSQPSRSEKGAFSTPPVPKKSRIRRSGSRKSAYSGWNPGNSEDADAVENQTTCPTRKKDTEDRSFKGEAEEKRGGGDRIQDEKSLVPEEKSLVPAEIAVIEDVYPIFGDTSISKEMAEIELKKRRYSSDARSERLLNSWISEIEGRKADGLDLAGFEEDEKTPRIVAVSFREKGKKSRQKSKPKIAQASKGSSDSPLPLEADSPQQEELEEIRSATLLEKLVENEGKGLSTVSSQEYLDSFSCVTETELLEELGICSKRKTETLLLESLYSVGKLSVGESVFTPETLGENMTLANLSLGEDQTQIDGGKEHEKGDGESARPEIDLPKSLCISKVRLDENKKLEEAITRLEDSSKSLYEKCQKQLEAYFGSLKKHLESIWNEKVTKYVQKRTEVTKKVEATRVGIEREYRELHKKYLKDLEEIRDRIAKEKSKLRQELEEKKRGHNSNKSESSIGRKALLELSETLKKEKRQIEENIKTLFEKKQAEKNKLKRAKSNKLNLRQILKSIIANEEGE
ncbi:putative low complexity protein with coiled coil regions [Cryptosporidium felis]|nr:putative low complexity protein with coiled coil regions [Cryptosporidium felis]